MNNCSSVMFPNTPSTQPQRVSVSDVVIAGLPSCCSLFLLMYFWHKPRKFSRRLRMCGQLLATIISGCQGLIVYRMFQIFDCEDLFGSPGDWVALPLTGLIVFNLIVIFIIAPGFPLISSFFFLFLAFLSVFAIWGGSNLEHKSAGVYLMPSMEQFFCTLATTFVLHARGNRGNRGISRTSRTSRVSQITDDSGRQHSTVNGKRTKKSEVMSIDPLQKRTSPHHHLTLSHFYGSP